MVNKKFDARPAISIDEEIREKTEQDIVHYALAGKAAMDRRLEELEREWDIDSCMQLNMGAISLISMILGATRSRLWRVVPFLGSVFLVQHAVTGWAPPMEFFRRLGIRTRQEIDHERYALKILRGDFEDLKGLPVKENQASIHDALEAVRR